MVLLEHHDPKPLEVIKRADDLTALPPASKLLRPKAKKQAQIPTTTHALRSGDALR